MKNLGSRSILFPPYSEETSSCARQDIDVFLALVGFYREEAVDRKVQIPRKLCRQRCLPRRRSIDRGSEGKQTPTSQFSLLLPSMAASVISRETQQNLPKRMSDCFQMLQSPGYALKYAMKGKVVVFLVFFMVFQIRGYSVGRLSFRHLFSY